VETPNLIPTVTKVSSDLVLFDRRSSSIAIESCITQKKKEGKWMSVEVLKIPLLHMQRIINSLN
jgi:hypothetical protein